ncbi:MAG: hypothetical protein IJ297_00890 [Clostridia bacterium]|nr:hypothetical protein [Clostridia bacterium]
MNNCSCRPNCIGIAVLASIVIGIIAGFLTVSGMLTVSTPFLWALFAVAVIGLGVILTLSVLSGARALRCICNAISLLLTGILGTLLTAVILLVIDIATASIAGAIITGLLFLFFTLLITTAACLVRCIADCDND